MRQVSDCVFGSPIERLFWQTINEFHNCAAKCFYQDNGKIISPIKRKVVEICLLITDDINPQYWIKQFRVDFAFPKFGVVVEIDGHEFHKTKTQRTFDVQRDRELMWNKWKVIRFTGSEIYGNPRECLLNLLEIVFLDSCRFLSKQSFRFWQNNFRELCFGIYVTNLEPIIEELIFVTKEIRALYKDLMGSESDLDLFGRCSFLLTEQEVFENWLRDLRR